MSLHALDVVSTVVDLELIFSFSLFSSDIIVVLVLALNIRFLSKTTASVNNTHNKTEIELRMEPRVWYKLLHSDISNTQPVLITASDSTLKRPETVCRFSVVN